MKKELLSHQMQKVHAMAHRAIPTARENVYLHVVDDEILYYILEPGACNCKYCVRIEPAPLTSEVVLHKEQSEGGDQCDLLE